MSGLVLNLRPYEKVLIGGVVLQNGQRRGQLRVLDEKASVLRLSEALHPDAVKTPLTRAYYAAQLLVSGDAPEGEGHPILQRLLADAVGGFEGFSFASTLQEAAEAAGAGQYCRVMRLLKPLLPKEAAILSRSRGDRQDRLPEHEPEMVSLTG
ncbi:flagellar biosynthesis repressor FlbT [Parvularcula oceani]|uniref:flagellar biosynthesis repressor FlbT n=1 Tax=Parvularcula oceani TaxID=1247963 RepID=UPI000691066D|nr:flagellar biosynthesis repressor FlbT [Parvularcula oceani]